MCIRDRIISKTHRATRIKAILSYDADYAEIIAGCRLIAERLQCALIEVEQFWRPSKHGPVGDRLRVQGFLDDWLEGQSVVLWDCLLYTSRCV